MTVQERIKAYLKYKKIGQAAFEKACGLSNGYVNNIKNSISNKVLQKIILIYTEVNPVWLMMGEGEMLKSSITQSQSLGNNSTIIGGNVIGGSQSIKENTLVPKELYDMLDKKDKQIDKLISIIEKLQK